ncbi:MAG: hypothetical protein HYS17_05530 [Micavibrio aeruginosavorus]|uniref:Uncharacterized protein n=1 Tax=Micavibrio aeruginosavorus TaxID=349221 RepID=A0A7T5R472_9BACT|nr:MAG: hypothetical protein HYS17_05530 [Micavibrio aeruginosavorus]
MRVRQGGHDVPKKDVTRRYERGLKNFFNLYEGLSHDVDIYNNTEGLMIPVASKSSVTPTVYLVYDETVWDEMIGKAGK